MSDNFSVDDILAEIDKKHGIVRQPKPETDISESKKQSLNLNNLNRENTEKGVFSLTEELSVIERRRGLIPEKEKPEAMKPKENENFFNKPQKALFKEPEKIEKSINQIPLMEEEKHSKPFGINYAPDNNNKKEVKKPETKKKSNPKLNDTMSVTQILDDKRLKKALRDKDRMGVTEILDSEEIKRRFDENPHASYDAHRKHQNKTDNKKEKPKKGEIIYEKARVLPKPLIEAPEKKPVWEQNAKAGTNEITIQDTEYKYPERDEKPFLQKTPEMERQEREEVLKKRDLSLLERDIALEQPHELIDGINPYEIIKNANTPDINVPEDIQFTDMSGDTQGIAGDDLKALAARSADENVSAYTTAEVGVKPYLPQSENKITETEPEYTPTEKAKRSNTALLESLNKAIREKRQAEMNAQRTKSIDGDKNSSKNIPSKVLNIDYRTQILKDTASIPINDAPYLAEQKMNDFAMKRKHKISDFVLEKVDSDEADSDYYDSEEDKLDFDSYDTSGQIWSDLCESHKGLKMRFIVLFVITGILVFLTVLNDFGQNLAFSLFGSDILFFDKRFDPTGFLYLNLIFGVIGVASCATVVGGGIKRLFTGNGDCDSICAVPAVVSLLCIVPQLQNTDFIQRSRASVFVAVGLMALLFNTIGKLIMIVRAKRNFRFISSDNAKYYASILEDEEKAQAFTKGIVHNLPVLVTMRKTEFLTDFLKNSYCTDMADRMSRILTPISLITALIAGLIAYFVPVQNPENTQNIYWALTAGTGMLSVLSPLSVMFMVNNPLTRASKALSKSNTVIMGYESVVTFSETNSVLVDASSLFPAGSVAFRNIKRCQQTQSFGTFAIDEAIITAASLAIKSGSILTYMFYDMIAGRSELLHEVDNCIYEVNMGILGWIGNKRIMLGNRDQMKHHGVKVPDIRKERKYCSENGDVVYLAVGGETVSMFFIEILPNVEIYRSMQELVSKGISIAVRTKDSLITINKLADVFDIPPEMVRVLPFDLHNVFDDCVKYTSRGNSSIACNGTFTSFARGLVAAKKLLRDINVSSWFIYTGAFAAVILGILFTLFASSMFTSTNILIYNLGWFILMLGYQVFRKYG